MGKDPLVLFVDDNPARAALMYERMSPQKRDSTIWCQTVEESTVIIEDYVDRLTEIYLGHDFGGQSYVESSRNDSGMEIVRWLEKKDDDFLLSLIKVKWTVHTWNIPAGHIMTRRLKNLGFDAEFIPFGN